MMRSSRSTATIIIALGAALMAPAAAPAVGEIGPGARLTAPAGCTMNFVFSDQVDLFVGTAGHCTNSVNERASAAGIGQFGTVVYRRLSGGDDFALIRIDENKHPNVDPSVRRFGGPTGVTSASETLIGDPLGLYGHGLGFGISDPTRSRVGVLADDDSFTYIAELPAIFGDSGGPVVHLPTGKALGVVSGIVLPTIPQGTLWGTTVERALSLLNGVGFGVEIVTAPSAILP